MQPIHIARNGKSLGRFQPQDVAEGLRDGKFLPTDLAWQDPLPAWIPLSQFDNLPKLPPADPVIPALPQTPPIPVEDVQPAWERRAELGFFRSFRETVTDLIRNPKVVWQAMKPDASIWGALLFYIITATLGGWIGLGYQIIAARMEPELLAKAFPGFSEQTIYWIFGISFVTTPIAVVILALVLSGIYYLCLMLLSKSPVRFESTFRIFCYAWGVASLFQLIPGCGAYIYPFLAVYLTAMGFMHFQKSTPTTSILTALLPVIFCCGTIFLLSASTLIAGK